MMITTVAGVSTMKPGAAGPPLPGIDAAVVDADGEAVDPGEAGYLVVEKPWPGMLRGLAGDDDRFVDEYWSTYSDPASDEWVYFPGDGARVDEEGYVTLLGRVDDVISVGDHRIGTMEVESTIVGVDGVAEAAVVGTGGTLVAFVSTEMTHTGDADLRATVLEAVEAAIGEVAVPDHVVFTPELPKTRSGKIMRRLLEGIATGESLGDISALRNPEVLGELRARLAGETQSYLERDG
jgi:acetyl-CoA synthetase